MDKLVNLDSNIKDTMSHCSICGENIYDMAATTKDPMTYCYICGENIHDMAAKGTFVRRATPFGVDFVGEGPPK